MKLKDAILKVKLDNPALSLRDIANRVGCEHTTVYKHLRKTGIPTGDQRFHLSETDKLLQSKGIGVKELKELLNPKGARVKLSKPRTTELYRLGVVSDTHLCDKACTVDEIHEAYAWFKREGVVEVVHAGDMTAGHNVYRGQMNDLLAFGFGDQLAYCEKNYPKVEGITTYFINGN